MKSLLFVLIASTILISCDYSDSEDPEFKATYNVEHYVRNQLKAPNSAEFSGTTATKIEDNIYLVTGSVDAQNSFGATLRKNFSCEIEFTSRNKYVIKDFTLE
jgi:hypothetical protein